METIPEGFAYKESTLPPTGVVADGRTVTLTLFDAPPTFTYTVIATNVTGTYSFAGTIRDSKFRP